MNIVPAFLLSKCHLKLFELVLILFSVQAVFDFLLFEKACFEYLHFVFRKPLKFSDTLLKGCKTLLHPGSHATVFPAHNRTIIRDLVVV